MSETVCLEEKRLTAVESKATYNSNTIKLLICIFLANLAIGGNFLFKAGTIVENVKSISKDTRELKNEVLAIKDLSRDVAVMQEKMSWVEQQLLGKKGF